MSEHGYTKGNAGFGSLFLKGFAGLAICALCVGTAQAQLLYSFESGLDGFTAQGGGDSDYINHTQSSIGATDGSSALLIETGTGFGRDVVVNETSGAIYDIFNTVAADPSLYTLDFDVTFTNDSWANLSDPGSYFQLGVFSNSDDSFTEQYGIANGSVGSASSFTASMPASQISLAQNSSFYQLGFLSNSNHANGPNGEGVTYSIDNIRFNPIPQYEEKVLFSWETPDNPATPGLDERFEGWQDGFGSPVHTRSIGTTGATEGSKTLEFEVPGSYTWGSQFVLDSSEDNGFPELQPLIDQLIDDFNGAEKLAFDVILPDDQFPGTPTYLSLFVHVTDQTGTYYQSPAKQVGNPVSQANETITIEVPLSEIAAGGSNLLDTDLQDGTFFRIAFATNSDDDVSFALDNFRLLSAIVEGVPGDFNDDGTVDAADYTVWRDNEGTSNVLPNDPDGGTIGAAQYATWVANYGSSSSSAAQSVPEPTSVVLVLMAAAGLAAAKRS